MSYVYAYMIADAILLVIWFAFFIARKDLRQKMLRISLVMGFVGILSELWYHLDYWKPELLLGRAIGIEDYLFGFTMSGIASVIGQTFFNMHFAERKEKNPTKNNISLTLVGIVLFNVFMFVFDLNSIYASSLGMIIVALVIIYKRNDLAFVSLVSGVLLSATFFLGYMVMLRMFPELFVRWWFLQNISGLTLAQVPVEELLWAFALGMMLGPAHEYLTGSYLKKLS